MNFENALSFAQQLDAEDELQQYRSHFLIPPFGGGDAIYFLGNSLGLQPKAAKAAIDDVLKQWQTLGVESFFKGENPWLQLHGQLTPVLSQIVGAGPHEVAVMNHLTVNLHLLLVSFYQPSGKRKKILCEAKAFPSDQYMLYSHVRSRGMDPDEVIVEVQPRQGEVLIREEDLLAAVESLGDELALVFWGGVNYYTGQVFNMEKLAANSRAAGAKIGFDLAHAAGNVPLQLHRWGVDFAAWCSYKYLNGGPGGMAGVYIHERYHRDQSLHRFAGWWGNQKETQFLMAKTFVPEPSAEGWQLSTPSPILYASQKAALNLFQQAGIDSVFEKNRQLAAYLWFLLSDISKGLAPGVIRILTPSHESAKGCQVSLAVKNGKEIFGFLTDNGVFADWREPDVIRVAPVGLYNTFAEVWHFAQLFNTALHKFAL